MITLNSGVGFETLFHKGLGINGEVLFSVPNPYGVGAFSLNGTYHFGRRELSPFVSVGYSLFFREGATNLFNLGGGVQLPLESGHCLRLEFRDHIFGDFSEKYHFFGFRIGWTF